MEHQAGHGTVKAVPAFFGCVFVYGSRAITRNHVLCQDGQKRNPVIILESWSDTSRIPPPHILLQSTLLQVSSSSYPYLFYSTWPSSTGIP